MLDLNVLLDVVQQREPFYAASAAVLSKVVARDAEGCVPGHAVTTLYYVVAKYAGRDRADELVDWMIAHFEILPEAKPEFLRARSLELADFEDAVVASTAEAGACEWIVTRNVADFSSSPVPAVTPEEFLTHR